MSDQNTTTTTAEDVESLRAERDSLRAEIERVNEIRAMGRNFDRESDCDRWISDGTSLEEVRAQILAGLAAQPRPGFRPAPDPYAYDIQMGRTAEEKRTEAITDGLLLRAGITVKDPAPGANEYRHRTLVEIARESLTAAGISTRGKGPSQIIKLATRASVVADFPELLANTAGKSLRLAYEQAPSTWRRWCKETSAKDFKEMSRVAISEAEDLDQVPEGGDYKYSEFSDNAEKFQVYTYGKLFAITRQALVNDDLGAFTRIPQAWAASAARKISALVYSILTSNPAMSDGTTLFHADHSNVGTGGAPSVTTLGEARKLMRLQTGPGGAILNIQPKFIIAPAALETAIDQLLVSVSMDDTNPAIVNPFRGKLEPIIEPILDGTSATAWYLAAAPESIDTVEVCFLEGRDYPTIETREGWTVDGVEFKARIDVGTKAIDHRGMIYNAGA